MKVHEYQAKDLLAKYGIPTPKGRSTSRAEESVAIAGEIGGPVVVKAQIHAGGRGKGGGIKLASTPDEAKKVASEIIGMTLVTAQTGPRASTSSGVLVEEQLDVARELYVSVVIDNSVGLPIVMASSEGGMEIEEVAAKNPEAIKRTPVDPAVGFEPFQGRELAFALGLSGDLMRPAAGVYRGALQALRGERLLPGRDQSAGRHKGRPAAGRRRQDQLR